MALIPAGLRIRVPEPYTIVFSVSQNFSTWHAGCNLLWSCVCSKGVLSKPTLPFSKRRSTLFAVSRKMWGQRRDRQSSRDPEREDYFVKMENRLGRSSLFCAFYSLSLDDDDITVKRRRRKIAVVTENCDCYSFLVGGGPEEGGRVIERDRNEQRTL